MEIDGHGGERADVEEEGEKEFHREADLEKMRGERKGEYKFKDLTQIN